MSGYQFFHVEAYALVGAKTTKKNSAQKRSIRQIIDEVERKPGSIPHIEKPENTGILYGYKPNEIEKICKDYANNSTDAKGRKFRKDGLILLSGVASLPRDREKDFNKFCTRVIGYLKKKYGDRLKSVVAHEKDESNPHIHFYVVPKVGEKLEDIHEGYKASKTSKNEGKLKGEQNQAYKTAMRGLQDEFNTEVGMEMGLTRLGPGRRRISRSQWVLEQKLAEQVAKQAAFLNDAKTVASKGYKDGKKLGYERGKQKFTEKNNYIGARLGGVLASLIGGLHNPTKAAQEEVSKAKSEAEKQKKLREGEVAKAKQEADRRVVALATSNQKYKNRVEDLERELEKLTNILQVDRLQLQYYMDMYGVNPNLPKPKK